MKNNLKKMVAGLVLIFATTFVTDAKAQSYEVYDGDTFSVMFTVVGNTAEDVKFASVGASKWTDFEVIDTKNWNGTGTYKNCLFTFYVLDSVYNSYQIDYYEDGYIWVFQVDDDLKQIGDGWRLTYRD